MNIEQAKQVLKNNGYIMHFWTEEDVKETAKNHINRELTQKELDRIIDLIEHNTDASIGINWEAIEAWIDYVINE